MATDFSQAPTDQGGFDLIPDGTLAFAILAIRAHNLDMGYVLKTGKDKPENRYLDIELVLEGGPFDSRKVWTMIGCAGSEKWVAMGMASVRHILEVGRNAGPGNPAGYVIGMNLPDGDEGQWLDLDGLRCAVEIGIEKGGQKQDGTSFPDKNRVKAFLSPNPDSPTHKKFQRLVAGDFGGQPAKPAAPQGVPWTPAAATHVAMNAPPGVQHAASPTPWQAPTVASRPAAPAAARPAAPAGRPGWMGAPPPAATAAEGSPPVGTTVKDVPF